MRDGRRLSAKASMAFPVVARSVMARSLVAVLVLSACSSASPEVNVTQQAADEATQVAPTNTSAGAALVEPTTAEAATATPVPTATEESQPATPAPAALEPATREPATPRPIPECRIEPNAPGPVSDLELNVEVVAEGLEVPWGLAVLPSGDLLVTERPGRVRLIESGVVVPAPVLQPRVELPPPLFGNDRLGPEGGLLGVVLHPDFATNQQFYLFYNLRNEQGDDIGRVERYVLGADARSASFDATILDNLPAGVHHQGGRMQIGPDGMLYVGVGAFDPEEAQDPTTLAGKLLRLELDGGIPTDNPDPNSYVFVSGIRNSQGFDWLDDDHIVMVDHGPSGLELNMPDLRGFDEVNVARAGDNLGWPRIWGCDDADGLASPVLTWNDSVPPTGGVFYRDDAIAEWTGRFLFTTVGRDFGQHLHSVEFQPDTHEVVSHDVHLFREYGRLRTVVSDGERGVYVMTSNCDGRGTCPPQGDVILRITGAR